MDQRSKLEEEREQNTVPTSPIVQPPSPIMRESGGVLATTPGDEDSSPGQQRRLSSSNRLTRQDQSIREGGLLLEISLHGSRKTVHSCSYFIYFVCLFSFSDDELTPPPTEIHSRKSIAEKDDQLPPLPLRPLPRRAGFRKPFISTHSDAADSAVSMVRSI